jgi:tetratricopeptide (TPR) repeat protein
MRLFCLLGISIALVVASVAAQAGEAPADAASAPPRDEPNAIDALVSPGEQSNTPEIQPGEDVGNRIAVAAHELDQKEYADAEQLLNGIVAELERTTSRYDPSLVHPLTMLGDALSGEAKYKEALRQYEQARHITRITNGLHTIDQIDLVYREANTLASMGKIERANDKQEYAYETLLRKYGPFSPSLIPGLYHLAAWYDRTSNIFAARGLYERAVDILARANGETDPSLIPALRGLANTYREERFPPWQLPEDKQPGVPLQYDLYESQGVAPVVVNRFGPGEVALLQIVKITAADPNAKPFDVALAELDLADWYLLFDKQARAVPVYVHARQIMRERVAMTDEQIAAYFGQPTVLYRPIPENPPAPPEPLRSNPTQGHIEVGYTVTEQGEVGDLKTLASEPEGLMDTKVRRGLRVSRFRPRFEGDNPVASPNQVYRQTFTYYPHMEGAAPSAKHPDEPKAANAEPPAG